MIFTFSESPILYMIARATRIVQIFSYRTVSLHYSTLYPNIVKYLA